MRGAMLRRAKNASTRCFSSSKERIITYLTDVEGDGDYLDRYVRQSDVLKHVPTTPRLKSGGFFPYNHRIDFALDQAHLVHGGDVWDKGGSDLYVIRQLLDLKQRYPDRVHFIMGNRDINKLRILQELGLFDPIPPHGGVYWLKGTGRRGDPELDNGGVPQESSVDRLHWMLTQTMGCPNSFELRQKELTEERQFVGSQIEVTPEDVVESYRWSCHPLAGEMGQYLSQASVALRLGDALFIHGCLPLTSDVLSSATELLWDDFGFSMPWNRVGPTPKTADDWIAAINKFAADDLEAWTENAIASEVAGYIPEGAWATVGTFDYWPSKKSSSYGRLLQYVMRKMPSMHWTPTIVSCSWMSNGMPRRFFPEATGTDKLFADLTRKFFDVAGLRLIVTGHKPVGDMPTAINVDSDKWVLCCDTSYSGDVTWLDGDLSVGSKVGRGNAKSARGEIAVSEVLMKQSADTGIVESVRLHGRLSDGTKYAVQNMLGSSTIGRRLDCDIVANDPLDWWVKASFDDGIYLLSSGEGFDVWNRFKRIT